MPHDLRFYACFLLVVAQVGRGIDNGLGLTPPMGWRSWNLYGEHVRQELIMKTMDGMAAREREVDGTLTSLCDLGYCDVGLDDNWQECNQAVYSYHDEAGKPVVNRERFPDMEAMTAHAHHLGLTAGWYGNNCICNESRAATHAMYVQDVEAIVAFGYDSVKLDHCGSMDDLDLWARLLNESGRAIMIENCHWGQTVPNATWCPWNMFRTSGDIRAMYGSMVSNLLTTVKWAQEGLSKPGCWAYPDMLEIGCQHGPGGLSDPGLSPAEARSHFGAWCIVSSPLVLSHDVNNDTVMDAIWPIISNKEAIAINQAWAGHSGSLFKQSPLNVTLPGYADQTEGPVLGLYGVAQGAEPSVANWHQFYKPLGGGRVAVLLMNHDSFSQDLLLRFAEVPGSPCTACHVRDVWRRRSLGFREGVYIAKAVGPHDSVFLVLSAAAAPSPPGVPAAQNAFEIAGTSAEAAVRATSAPLTGPAAWSIAALALGAVALAAACRPRCGAARRWPYDSPGSPSAPLPLAVRCA